MLNLHQRFWKDKKKKIILFFHLPQVSFLYWLHFDVRGKTDFLSALGQYLKSLRYLYICNFTFSLKELMTVLCFQKRLGWKSHNQSELASVSHISRWDFYTSCIGLDIGIGHRPSRVRDTIQWCLMSTIIPKILKVRLSNKTIETNLFENFPKFVKIDIWLKIC